MVKSSRIELRADPEREQRIRQAAELEHRSVSSFVLEAAAERAEAVIAAASTTTVPGDWFDQLWSALEAPPEPDPAVARLARAPRRIEQR